MPHTNTIEALTLELDRVNEENRAMKEVMLSGQYTYLGGEYVFCINPDLVRNLNLRTALPYVAVQALAGME